MNNHFSPQTLDFQVSNNDISSYSDENIIQFIVDHNNNEDKNLGYTQLYQKYLPKALNYYKVHEINEEDAKDHAQQLFINIIDNIGKFKLDAKFNSRFYWMMRNELVDSKRKETKNNNRMKDYFHTQKNKSYHEN
jgi:DNA-directed RNA polymerase specialized sigma24 family protein